MATLMLADLLLLGEPNPAHTPHEPLGRSPFRMRTIRSLRLRHTTLRSGLPSSRKAPTPAARCASLSTCFAPIRSPQSLPYRARSCQGSLASGALPPLL